ncbi:MAG: DUF433 domain-containing protein [Candidatus Methanodesulfokora sp.]
MRIEIGRYIVIDDEICHGKPTFKGTRVLVSDVIELLAAGLSPEEIIRDYYPSLNEEMIREALEWAAKIIRGEHYVKYTELPA